jgi:hypothetical protein
MHQFMLVVICTCSFRESSLSSAVATEACCFPPEDLQSLQRATATAVAQFAGKVQ